MSGVYVTQLVRHTTILDVYSFFPVYLFVLTLSDIIATHSTYPYSDIIYSQIGVVPFASPLSISWRVTRASAYRGHELVQ